MRCHLLSHVLRVVCSLAMTLWLTNLWTQSCCSPSAGHPWWRERGGGLTESMSERRGRPFWGLGAPLTFARTTAPWFFRWVITFRRFARLRRAGRATDHSTSSRAGGQPYRSQRRLIGERGTALRGTTSRTSRHDWQMPWPSLRGIWPTVRTLGSSLLRVAVQCRMPRCPGENFGLTFLLRSRLCYGRPRRLTCRLLLLCLMLVAVTTAIDSDGYKTPSSGG